MRDTIVLAGLVVIFGAVVCGPAAEGAIITIAIEGVVDYVDDPYGLLPGDIEAGAGITGTYKYESSTADSNPFATFGSYWHRDPHGIFLDVGGVTFRSRDVGAQFLVEITNDYPPFDDYYLLSYNNEPLAYGIPVHYISWHLHDPSGTAVSSVQLPTTVPVLDDWDANILSITGKRYFGIKGHVTSAAVVPEPTTVILLSIGSLALVRKKVT